MSSFINRMPTWLQSSWDALLLLVLASWLLFAQLGSPLMEPDESRYAEIPRLMLRSGDWITPKLQGKAYNDKPPLVYWVIAGSYAVFGVSIEAARFVPATVGLLTLIIVYLWSRRYLGRSSANAAVLILMTMLGYLAFMRMLLLDGVLAFLIVGSLLAGHHALAQKRHQGWWLISAILCGLGVLAKGPVAIVLVTPCFFALRWLDRTTTPMRFLDATWYGLVVLALSVPWYAVMMLTNEGFGSEHFIRHHLQRFLDPAHHERPFWFYVPALFIEMLPWPALLLPLWLRWRTWTGTDRFLMFFSTLCFFFFSVAKAKLPTYLLPMLPAVAMLFGRQLLLTITQLPSEHRVRWGILATALGIFIIVIFRSLGFDWVLNEGSPRVDLWVLGVLLIMIIVLLASSFPQFQQNNSIIKVQWGITIFAAGMATVFVTHRAIPDYSRLVSVVEPCRQLIALADREGIPYVAHRNSWDAVSFMLNREELEVYSSREAPAFYSWINNHIRCMIWMRDYENRIETFTKTLPAGIEVEQIYHLGRMQAIILKQSAILPAGFTPRATEPTVVPVPHPEQQTPR